MIKFYSILCSLGLFASLSGCGSVNNTPSTSSTIPSNTATTSNGTAAPTSSPWMSFNASAKTVNLVLKAGSGGGFDFNGFSKGAMTVTVPTGWKVIVNFTNEAAGLAHSAMIVPFSQVQAGQNFTPAFSGASSPNPTTGSAQGIPQQFTFTASTVGKYGIVCAVPGHDDAGMWDTFVVSSSATVPSVTT